ncbi:MAG: SpoIIE family protein phosphatase [Acidobacteria bacterium]|nr:SpoIIE family protein phosphatase [Acidobacteriota bacterium]
MAAHKAAVPPFLVLIMPDGERREVPITTSPFRIGRLVHNDLILPDDRISREHACIVAMGERYYLEDRNSKHGVFLNGERIERRALEPNDLIEFGKTLYRLIFTHHPSQSNLPSLLETLDVGSSRVGNLGRLGAVLEVARALETESLEAVLGAVVDAALGVTRAERGFLLLQSPDSGELEMRVARDQWGRPLGENDLRVPRSVIQDALRRRRGLLSLTFDRDQRDPGTTVDDLDLRSAVCVPLARLRLTQDSDSSDSARETETLGVLYMDSCIPSSDLSAGDQDLVVALAIEASTALENARLWSEARENRRLRQELSIVCRIHSALLPAKLPDQGWLRAAGASHPCFQVGGDYYDVMQTSPALWSAVVADVAGKGLSAAVLASLLQGAFSVASLFTAAGHQASLAEVLALVSRYVFERSLPGDFATVFYATLQQDGLLRWANAGHCPALLVRPGPEVLSLCASGVPLGLFSTSSFAEEQIQLQSADKLVIYTDGVTEAENAFHELFGYERLEELVGRHYAAPAAQLHHAILDAVSAFTAGVPQRDDVTLVVLEYVGEAASEAEAQLQFPAPAC